MKMRGNRCDSIRWELNMIQSRINNIFKNDITTRNHKTMETRVTIKRVN